jgi:hypothetical protein
MTDDSPSSDDTWSGAIPLDVFIDEDTVTIIDANGLEVAHCPRDEIVEDPDVAFAVAAAVDRAHSDPVGLLEQHQSPLAAQHS